MGNGIDQEHGTMGTYNFTIYRGALQTEPPAISSPSQPSLTPWSSMDADCTLSSNPDISGRGVRAAIYLQNLLCFFPAIWALWDGKVTEYELDSVENHSMTNLILAFAILISCIVQALGTRGLSNYHTSIILTMSWMNNTNAFIYFLLYVQYKTQQGMKPSWMAWGEHLKGRIQVVLLPFRGHQTIDSENGRRWYSVKNVGTDAAKVLFGRIAIFLGSFHLTVMAALGIWLWSAPQAFGTSDTDPECAFKFARLTIMGFHAPFHSNGLRIASLALYSSFLVPGFNLLLPILTFLWLHLMHRALWPEQESFAEAQPASDLLPMDVGTRQPQPLHSRLSVALQSCKAAVLRFIRSPTFPAYFGLFLLLVINVVLIVDIELTLQQNRHLQGPEELQWGFGQILAITLLTVPLRDIVEAIFRRRQEMQTQLDNALKKAIDDDDMEKIVQWFHAGANPNVRSDHHHRTVLEAAELAGDWNLFQEIAGSGVDLNSRFSDLRTPLEAVAQNNQWHLLSLLIDAGADINCRFSDDSNTVLHVVCERGPSDVFETLWKKTEESRPAGPGNMVVYLHSASTAGRQDVIRFLLENGADPNSEDEHGKTPLDAACGPVHQHIGSVVLLLKKGAKPTPDCAIGLCKIAQSLRAGVQLISNLDDMIMLQRAAVKVQRCVLSRTECVYPLLYLAECLHSRLSDSEGHTSIPDIEEAVQLKREALQYVTWGGRDCVECLRSLATSLHSLSHRIRSVDARDEAIRLESQVVDLHPPGDGSRARPLLTLAKSLCRRSTESGSDEDMDEAIKLGKEAFAIRSVSDEDRPVILQTLAILFYYRAVNLGSVSDVDEAIQLARTSLAMFPRKGREHSETLSPAGFLFWRSKETTSIRDIDEVVFLMREVLNDRPLGCSYDRIGPLNTLAASLEIRFSQTGSILDVDEAISIRDELLLHHPEGHPDRATALTDLVSSLRGRYGQMGLEADIHTAISLCRRAFEGSDSDSTCQAKLHFDLADCLQSHAGALSSATAPSYYYVPNEHNGAVDPRSLLRHLVNEVVGTRTKALSHIPIGSPHRIEYLRSHILSLHFRFWLEPGSTEAIDEAIRLEREVVDLEPPHGHDCAVALLTLAVSLSCRSGEFQSREDAQEAIDIGRNLLGLHPAGSEDHLTVLGILAPILYEHSHNFGSLDDLSEAIGLTRTLVELLPPKDQDHPLALRDLAFSLLWCAHRRTWPSDVQWATFLLKDLCNRSPDHEERIGALSSLASYLHHRYGMTGSDPDLEEAIRLKRGVLKRRVEGNEGYYTALRSLIASLRALHRSVAFCDTPKSQELLDLELQAELVERGKGEESRMRLEEIVASY